MSCVLPCVRNPAMQPIVSQFASRKERSKQGHKRAADQVASESQDKRAAQKTNPFLAPREQTKRQPPEPPVARRNVAREAPRAREAPPSWRPVLQVLRSRQEVDVTTEFQNTARQHVMQQLKQVYELMPRDAVLGAQNELKSIIEWKKFSLTAISSLPCRAHGQLRASSSPARFALLRCDEFVVCDH